MIKLSDLDKYKESIYKSFENNNVDKEVLTKINNRFKKYKSHCNLENISYCLEMFITAEIDYQTKGKRGMGRMTAVDVPRLGGYFRKQISRMTKMERDKLYELIQDIILSAYFFSVFFIEHGAEESIINDKEKLFRAWLPKIYVTDPTQLGNTILSGIKLCTASSIENIQHFFKKHKMRKGFWIFKRDKTDRILLYYAIAGYGLRMQEIPE